MRRDVRRRMYGPEVHAVPSRLVRPQNGTEPKQPTRTGKSYFPICAVFPLFLSLPGKPVERAVKRPIDGMRLNHFFPWDLFGY